MKMILKLGLFGVLTLIAISIVSKEEADEETDLSERSMNGDIARGTIPDVL